MTSLQSCTSTTSAEHLLQGLTTVASSIPCIFTHSTRTLLTTLKQTLGFDFKLVIICVYKTWPQYKLGKGCHSNKGKLLFVLVMTKHDSCQSYLAEKVRDQFHNHNNQQSLGHPMIRILQLL